MSTNSTTGARVRPPREGRSNGQWLVDGQEPLNHNEEFKAADDGLNVRARIEQIYAREGFAAIPRIVREGMQVTATGIHSSMQGFMAAKAGARFVAPYVNRMDNYGIDGVRVASEILRTNRHHDGAVGPFCISLIVAHSVHGKAPRL